MNFHIFTVLSALVLVALFTPLSAQAAGEEKIAAVVNQDAITMSDLNDRIKLIAISSGLADAPGLRAKLLPQVLDSLIEEQLMVQEAKKDEVAVTDAEIEQGFATLAKQNNAEVAPFKEAIQRAGINLNTMRNQIRAQMGWSKVIAKVMRPEIDITDADVDDYITRIAANKGKTEYLVAEIFLPVDSQSQDNETKQLADRLVTDMKAGKAPFVKVAQQFSKAPGAAQGGDRGWLQQGQLEEPLDSALQKMEKNGLSDPIRLTDGYHILLLRDSRTITDQSLPTRDQAMSALGLQRLDRAQRRYMMDLKSAAFVEKRAES
jgi:peptidyl-prolyl cis-trans isomerase SurA